MAEFLADVNFEKEIEDDIEKILQETMPKAEEKEKKEFLASIDKEYLELKKILRELRNQSRIEEATSKLYRMANLDKIKDRTQRSNEAQKSLNTLLHQINKQKKSERTRQLLLSLYHITNVLAAKVSGRPEVQYKILFNYSYTSNVGGEKQIDRTVAEFSGTFEQAVALNLIRITKGGNIVYGPSISDSKLSSSQKELYKEAIKNSTIQIGVLERNMIQDLRKRKEMSLNDLKIKLQTETTPFRKFTYIYAYLFQEAALPTYTIGHYYETFQQLAAENAANAGSISVAQIIQAAKEAKGTDPWIVGGDVLLNKQDFQVKAFIGNYTEPKQIITFATLLCANIEKVKSAENFSIEKDNLISKYTKDMEKEINSHVEADTQKFVDNLKKEKITFTFS